ncbi:MULTISPECIES: N-formylglutamate amidohydrolase [unclassified Brevundimonas]|uniref:N-formylglutamate amidohydrolase n=1 Tax=unclassified Brevundimonas TaxID=2622653 RepID=UPI000CFA8884|nr:MULTISPECIES: N-formylglutamate amidohydrolase [unclassified Brevundimonas]PRA33319.1 N-formylglutamate amidohydrolase [Brevundimonas sp. MYb27]PQZ83842.1 N-formylglutamate amidohydrolase [Brevundimonas sp. MYb31]PRB13771.1 N-formylglutamate amidohydrolase [Brevundimonas sp. MYb52]PRB34496.1 N-formylglutamate amidohydrolase [Brevundimonas sp. MYb46]PRB53974.1 N-formylglutamate amidohydrolase [Brevundimonas sp. MYb33]
MNPAPTDATFSLVPVLRGRATPLVFASPHSGELYPEDMAAAEDLSEMSLRSAEDAAVDRLLGAGAAAGAALIAGRIGRAYVDLNRAPEELDPILIDGVSATPPPGLKTQAGYGVIPRLAGDGAPLYDRRLTREEAVGRITRVHQPYHEALGDLMRAALARHGRAVLVDWHSMPSRATGPNGPDVVLGDRHGASCETDLTRRLRALFEAMGWRVALNRPYAGGYATQLWGRPEEGFEAIQIELNRRLYWDEASGGPSAGWGRCQSGLNRVIAALGQDFAA